MTHRRAVVILLGCTFIWGASFTLNKLVLKSVSPMVMMATRFAISSLLLAWVYRRTTRSDWRVGLPLGVLFGLQLALFITGLATIPASRSAFLFSVQTPLIPLFVLLGERKFPTGREITAVALAMAGAWLLTRPEGDMTGLSTGDLLTLGSAVAGALYVVAAGRWSPRHDSLNLLAVQMPVLALFALGLGTALEQPRFEASAEVLLLIPFLALSSIATFGGQLLGQRLIRPTEAALIYAMEPIVAAGVGMFTLGERLAAPQWGGAGLIVAGCLAVSYRSPPS